MISHISLIRVKIKNPNMNLLREAVKNLAMEIGAELVNEVVDYYGRKVKVDLGIKNDVFHRGVGITVQNGEVKLIGDFYGYRQHVEQLQLGLVKHYTALATAVTLRNMGYQVQSSKVKNSIFIRAVAY